MSGLRTLASTALVAALALWIGGAPAQAVTPPNPEGDANCDKVTNSIDAALILQLDAGLIDDAPCPDFANVNCDRHVDSLDAALVLQIVAGLCCEEPLVAELTIVGLAMGVPFGEPLEMTLSITNISDEPIKRGYGSSMLFDFTVDDADGNEVWRWARYLVFLHVLGSQTWAPGESVTYTVTWDQLDDTGGFLSDGEQVPAGIYTLRGWDVGCGSGPGGQRDLGARLTFEILPPPQ